MGVKRMIVDDGPIGSVAAKVVVAASSSISLAPGGRTAVPTLSSTVPYSGRVALARPPPRIEREEDRESDKAGTGAAIARREKYGRIASLLRTASALNDYAVDLHNQEGSDPSAAMKLFRQARETFVKSVDEAERADGSDGEVDIDVDERRHSSSESAGRASEGGGIDANDNNKRARSKTIDAKQESDERRAKKRVRRQQQGGSSEQQPQQEEQEVPSNDEGRREKPEEEGRPAAANASASASANADDDGNGPHGEEDEEEDELFLRVGEEPPPYLPSDDYDDDQYGLGLYREETDDAHGGTVRFRRTLKMSAYYPEPDEPGICNEAFPIVAQRGGAHDKDAALAFSHRGAALASFNLALARNRLLTSPKSASTAIEALASSPSALRLLDSAASHLRSIPRSRRTDRDRSLEVMVHNNAAGAHIEAGGDTALALRSLLRALRVEAPEKYMMTTGGSHQAAREDDDDDAAIEERQRRDEDEREERDEASIVAALALKLTELHAIGLARQNEASDRKNKQALLLLGAAQQGSSDAAGIDVALLEADAFFTSGRDREADDYILRQSVTSSNVGQIYFRSLRFSESAAACLISDTLRSSVLPGGSKHVLAAACKYNLGLILHRLGDVASAGRCYAAFLIVAENWTADDSGGRDDSDNDEAYPVLDRALKSSVASARHQWGLVLSALGDKQNAIGALLRVLAERRALHGGSDCHPDIAKTLFSLGQALFESGRIAEASLYFEEAINVSRTLRLDPAHMIFVFALSYLAQIRQRLGDGGAAIALYDEALALAQRAFGETHYVVINLLNAMGNLRVSRGELNAARRCFTRASGIYVLGIMRGCKQALVEAARRQERQVQGRQHGAAAAPAENGTGAGASSAATSSSTMSSARAIGGTTEADSGGAFVVVTTRRKIGAQAA